MKLLSEDYTANSFKMELVNHATQVLMDEKGEQHIYTPQCSKISN